MAARSSPAASEPGFRGPTVIKLVGITYRQLDYWARTGLVTPSVRAADGSGTQRLYGFTDVVELRIIKRLLDAGSRCARSATRSATCARSRGASRSATSP